MRKNIIYSSVVFFLVFVFVCAMFVTSLVMGDSNWGDLKFVLGIATAASTVAAFPFFFAITFLRNRFIAGIDAPDYRPGAHFMLVVVILLMGTVYAGVNRMHTTVTQKRLALVAEQHEAEMQLKQAQARVEAAEASRNLSIPTTSSKLK